MEVFGCVAWTRCLGVEFRVFDRGKFAAGGRFPGVVRILICAGFVTGSPLVVGNSSGRCCVVELAWRFGKATV